jgi:hypothetical protein
MSRIPQLDFIEVIQSTPLTRAEAAEISAWIRRSREASAKAKAVREKLEAKALALPNDERTQLAYQLLKSLAADESNHSKREWAAAATVLFEQLHSKQTPASSRPGKKPRRSSSSPAKRRTPSASSK